MTTMETTLALRRVPLRLTGRRYLETKDPCPVFDGRRWHLFGTGVTRPHTFEVLHATADTLGGPWVLGPAVDIDGLSGGCVAAPGAVADGPTLHLFLQTEYCVPDGRVEHLVSHDSGQTFTHAGSALTSIPGTAESGIYDPHPAVVHGAKYLVYSAFDTIGQPDVHLARSSSGTWDGPWDRLGPVLRHEEVAFHNQRGIPGYEWGLEGAQIVELPDGRVLLNAVGFLSGHRPGTRQRVFFALGRGAAGPFEVLGPLLAPAGGEGTGENGHASVVLDGEELVLFFQERSLEDPLWHMAVARGPLPAPAPADTSAAHSAAAHSAAHHKGADHSAVDHSAADPRQEHP